MPKTPQGGGKPKKPKAVGHMMPQSYMSQMKKQHTTSKAKKKR